MESLDSAHTNAQSTGEDKQEEDTGMIGCVLWQRCGKQASGRFTEKEYE